MAGSAGPGIGAWGFGAAVVRVPCRVQGGWGGWARTWIRGWAGSAGQELVHGVLVRRCAWVGASAVPGPGCMGWMRENVDPRVGGLGGSGIGAWGFGAAVCVGWRECRAGS